MLDAVLFVLAISALVGWACISLFSKVKLMGSYLHNPIAKMLVGPAIVIVGGLMFMLYGLLGISPFILLVRGEPGWALLVFLVQLVLSCFTKIEAGGFDISWETPLVIRMAGGMFLLWIGGAAALIIGAILAFPAWAIALVLI